MFTRPTDLPDTAVAEALRSGWSLDVESITHAPLGFGSHHWRVTADGRQWFVTVDDLRLEEDAQPDTAPMVRLSAALSTSRLLSDLGLGFVVAPVPATTGGLLMPIAGHYAIALYPHVDGAGHRWGPFPGRDEVLAVLSVVVALHTAPTSVRRHALVDNFAVQDRHRLEAALADRHHEWNSGPYGEPTRRLLEGHLDRIGEEFARYDRLAEGASRPDRMVITHGEPHRGNTITTDTGVVLVDWDTVLVAPPERDLWWLAKDDATVLGEYENRTGTVIDASVLELYRQRWDLGDLAGFAADFHRNHEDNEDTLTAWNELREIFDRG